MAYEKDLGLSHAALAASDLSAKLYYMAKITSTGLIDLQSSAGAMGFPITEAAALNKPVTIRFGGIAKIIAGATFNAGVFLTSDANGKVQTATSGQDVIGVALEACTAVNQIVSVMLTPAPTP